MRVRRSGSPWRSSRSDWISARVPSSETATGSSTEVPGLSVLRVIRMVRVLRLLKMSKGSVMLFAETMQKSFKPLTCSS